jgi:hypothetical protein
MTTNRQADAASNFSSGQARTGEVGRQAGWRFGVVQAFGLQTKWQVSRKNIN